MKSFKRYLTEGSDKYLFGVNHTDKGAADEIVKLARTIGYNVEPGGSHIKIMHPKNGSQVTVVSRGREIRPERNRRSLLDIHADQLATGNFNGRIHDLKSIRKMLSQGGFSSFKNLAIGSLIGMSALFGNPNFSNNDTTTLDSEYEYIKNLDENFITENLSNSDSFEYPKDPKTGHFLGSPDEFVEALRKIHANKDFHVVDLIHESPHMTKEHIDAALNTDFAPHILKSHLVDGEMAEALGDLGFASDPMVFKKIDDNATLNKSSNPFTHLTVRSLENPNLSSRYIADNINSLMGIAYMQDRNNPEFYVATTNHLGRRRYLMTNKSQFFKFLETNDNPLMVQLSRTLNKMHYTKLDQMGEKPKLEYNNGSIARAHDSDEYFVPPPVLTEDDVEQAKKIIEHIRTFVSPDTRIF